MNSPRPTGLPPLSPGVAAIRPSTLAVLLERMRTCRAPIFPFHLGDLHRPPPAALVDHAAALARDPAVWRYSHPQGDPELRAALAAHLQTRGVPATSDTVCITVGATGALSAACATVLSSGDELLMVAPYWPIMKGTAEKTGCRVVEVDLTQRMYADPWLDVAAVLDGHTSTRTRALYLTSPNNPDGKVWSPAQLKAVAAWAQRHNAWVLEDAAYADLCFDGGPVRSVAALPGMEERTLHVGCFSKTFSMTGMRLGWLWAPPRATEHARKLVSHEAYHPNVLAQRLALRALDLHASTAAALVEELRGARDALCTALSGMPLWVPEGGAFVFVDGGRALAGRSAREFCMMAVDEGVVVAPGDLFGASYGAFVRLNFSGMPAAQLQEGAALFRRLWDRFTE